jgi:hypothetical protein
MCQELKIFLNCHRNVTKHINRLQVDNLITNKFVANLDAPRRNMNTRVKILLLNEKKKKNLKPV